VNSSETYIKQWEPWEGTRTKLPGSAYDELADILCEEAKRGELVWFDGTPVFDNDRHTKEVQK